jgi:hypothetical protein
VQAGREIPQVVIPGPCGGFKQPRYEAIRSPERGEEHAGRHSPFPVLLPSTVPDQPSASPRWILFGGLLRRKRRTDDISQPTYLWPGGHAAAFHHGDIGNRAKAVIR